jgi:hypothetical protein
MQGARAGAGGAVVHHSEHHCLVYDDAGRFLATAQAFLAAGRAAGARLELLGSGSVEALRSRLRAVEGFPPLLDSGHLAVRSLQDHYGPAEVVDPRATVAAYADATDAALRAGFTALRVVADVTALVRTPAQQAAFGAYEALVDRYMVGHPFEALCAYDGRVLGQRAAAELACLHPRVNAGATAFQLHAAADADLRLLGEVDAAARDVFEAALARTFRVLDGASRRIDARRLGFIDHQGMLALERTARDAGVVVALRTDSSLVHRLASLLRLRFVQPTAPAVPR